MAITALVCVVSAIVFVLHGCGGGGNEPKPGPGQPTPAPTSPPGQPTPAPTSPIAPPEPMPSPKDPIRGMCYAPRPLPSSKGSLAPEDMADDHYSSQWGPSGRDDFGIMKRMGVNTIRLYHPMGEELFNGKVEPNHGGILEAANHSGLNVFAAVHQYLQCPEDDCSEAWAAAVERGLDAGFAKQDRWHPSVWAINLINEVDAIVPFNKGEQQVKRLISAADGLLSAEKKKGVKGTVNMTSCFTTAIATPLGGGKATIYHGFTSIEYWIKNPSSVDYTPKAVSSLAELASVINSRWLHCVNAQMPWINGMDMQLAKDYEQFLPRPWLVGEMGFNGGKKGSIEGQLKAMHDYAKADKGFLGTFFFQFQTAYWKTGPELNYGIFGLGEKTIGVNATIAGESYPIHCLTSRLYAFEQPHATCGEDCNHRAEAVASAFEGSLTGRSLCLNSTPLAPPKSLVYANQQVVV